MVVVRFGGELSVRIHRGGGSAGSTCTHPRVEVAAAERHHHRQEQGNERPEMAAASEHTAEEYTPLTVTVLRSPVFALIPVIDSGNGSIICGRFVADWVRIQCWGQFGASAYSVCKLLLNKHLRPIGLLRPEGLGSTLNQRVEGSSPSGGIFARSRATLRGVA